MVICTGGMEVYMLLVYVKFDGIEVHMHAYGKVDFKVDSILSADSFQP